MGNDTAVAQQVLREEPLEALVAESLPSVLTITYRTALVDGLRMSDEQWTRGMELKFHGARDDPRMGDAPLSTTTHYTVTPLKFAA